MKYCEKCGKELFDDAVICPGCGCRVDNRRPAANQSGLKTAAKVFMVLGTIALGIAIIPLAWCIPMTISYFNKTNRGEPVSLGFKICTMLFVNMIGGILMLCADD